MVDHTQTFVEWWHDGQRADCTLTEAIGLYVSTFPGRTIPFLEECVRIQTGQVDVMIAGDNHEDVGNDVVKVVVEMFKVRRENLMGKARTHHVAAARSAAMWLMRDIGFSYANIGKVFGRDHSTVVYNVQTIKERMQVDTILSQRITQLKSKWISYSSK